MKIIFSTSKEVEQVPIQISIEYDDFEAQHRGLRVITKKYSIIREHRTWKKSKNDV